MSFLELSDLIFRIKIALCKKFFRFSDAMSWTIFSTLTRRARHSVSVASTYRSPSIGPACSHVDEIIWSIGSVKTRVSSSFLTHVSISCASRIYLIVPRIISKDGVARVTMADTVDTIVKGSAIANIKITSGGPTLKRRRVDTLVGTARDGLRLRTT